jgi:enoyl-CoA hydratase/carnithine racemase
LPRDEVLPAALAHAREFRLAAPASVALSKRLLWEGLGLSALEMMKRENPLFAWVGSQPDAREGVLAFLEKREPAWKLRPSMDLPER